MTGSTQAQQLLTKATALYHSGDYRQAIQIWQEVLAQDPKNQRALEGIRMASLLMEEAQAGGAATQSVADGVTSETPEGIAKVREGIQKVREFLSVARYLDAMEVCQALLQLAPRSEAVREVLEEARDAYEAQPFIDEHLEIARQLFVQERLDEASAEIQKVFFLSANHAEAKKLEAKIEALRQRQSPASTAPEVPSATPPFDGEATQALKTPREGGDALDLSLDTHATGAGSPAAPPPAQPRQSTASSSPKDEPALNEDWEAELAQMNLGPGVAPGTANEADAAMHPEPEPIPLTDLSEDSSHPSPRTTASSGEWGADAGKPAPEVDLSELGEALSKRGPESAAGELHGRAHPARASGKSTVKNPLRSPAPQRRARSGLSLGKSALVLLILAVLLAGGWWMLGGGASSASGQGGSPGAPPAARPPLKRPSTNPAPPGGPSNVGLSSNSSRPANTAAAQGAAGVLPGANAPIAPPTSPEEMKREVTSLFAKGKTEMAHSQYEQAVETFSRILDLDAANLEAKENLDAAASRVQEQKRLEEDLQTGKQFFVEKDYESALRKFYRLPKDRNLGEVDLFIRNAWFNWAVMSLKGGNCIEALQRLQEDLTLNPDDEEAGKLKEVAEHYRDRPKDKVFYAYVDRLTYRTLNQK